MYLYIRTSLIASRRVLAASGTHTRGGGPRRRSSFSLSLSLYLRRRDDDDVPINNLPSVSAYFQLRAAAKTTTGYALRNPAVYELRDTRALAADKATRVHIYIRAAAAPSCELFRARARASVWV